MITLYNKLSKEEARKKLMEEPFKRTTVSFYRYVIIQNPAFFRDHLYYELAKLNCFGRIYVAREGINAQMSVPEDNWDAFIAVMENITYLQNMPLKMALEDDGKSFYKLTIKVREKIVADGLNDDTFDVTNVGNHLSAEEFNAALEDPNTIVVDMRNYYESEVGHFVGAICPEVDTFKEELQEVVKILDNKKDNKVLMYCTGGIRCEKASAWMKHNGFTDVNQLHGGIISYAQQIKEKGLESKYIGKNFVFDERLGERITDDIISTCHQCGEPCDTHTNCANAECHLLFIQCPSCSEKYEGCCTPECQEIIHLPKEEQVARRKGNLKKENNIYKSRLRPNLKKILATSSKKEA